MSKEKKNVKDEEIKQEKVTNKKTTQKKDNENDKEKKVETVEVEAKSSQKSKVNKEKTESKKEEKVEKDVKPETKKEVKAKGLKMGFFKKAEYSITNIEKYPDMAAQGFGSAINYLVKIIAILAIILSLGMVYNTHKLIGKGVHYLRNQFPEFSYTDGSLNIESEEIIEISEEDSIVGYTIIDTKTEEEQTINKYINDIEQSGGGLVVLKDKIIFKNSSVAGTINYAYKDIFEQVGITQFVKEDVINYANSTKIISLYISVFLTIFIYGFVMYLLTTLSNAVFLSLFGWLTTWIAKIRMRYVAIFNMAVYALTLSTILNMLYIGINIFINFNMEYFQVMYISVAAIYLVAAIFILKTEFIKKQAELIKIIEAQEKASKELNDKKEENKDTDKKEKKQKEDKKEGKTENKEVKKDNSNKEENKEKSNNKEDNNIGEEPEGSNA